MNRTNSVIKFDLHIHSKASSYKEADGIVDNSTKENLSVLFQKLNENNVALFSITDHNRFDAELYKEIEKILKEKSQRYPNVLNVLPGVEFDVKLEDNMEKCHIIAIFDAKNTSDYEKIENIINSNKLERKEDFYKKTKFEQLLKDIQLDVILIVHQKKDIYHTAPSKHSLSDACSNIKEIIELGYINALEFQKPRIEGILCSNLKKLNIKNYSLVSGSDCHNWTNYPSNPEFRHSEAKILPTFKGLLMAVTSPETRFNRTDEGKKPITSIKINDKYIPLTNGINVIIGENGSGKSSLLEALTGKKKIEKHVQKIINDNHISYESEMANVEKKYIAQGEIIQNFYKENLFEKDNYKEINNERFKSVYDEYSKNLYNAIKEIIKKKKLLSSLNDKYIKFEKIDVNNSYYIEIIDNIKSNSDENKFEDSFRKANELFEKTKMILNDPNFKKYKTEIEKALSIIEGVYTQVKKEYELIKDNNKVINIIHGCIRSYSGNIRMFQDKASTKSSDIRKNINSFINNFVDNIKDLSASTIKWPNHIPSPLTGATSNKKAGFNFNLEANYNNRDVFPDFLEAMFVSKYRDIEKLKTIDTDEAFQSAVWNCSTVEAIGAVWNENYEKFYQKETLLPKKYISKENGSNKIGNTLGEISLAYYEYCTSEESSLWNLLMIDQPEDNISNNNIKEKLISYFNYIRTNESNKQIIFVTHNPLLVVNLDADNVIFLKNNEGIIETHSGCLEYEDPETNILELIANSMDGGRDTIERRLKIYGKNH